jgi:hypothetical protein
VGISLYFTWIFSLFIPKSGYFCVKLSSGEFDINLFASEFTAKEVISTGVSA